MTREISGVALFLLSLTATSILVHAHTEEACNFQNTTSTELICKYDTILSGSQGEMHICLCKHTCLPVTLTCKSGRWQHNCTEQLPKEDKSIEKCVTCSDRIEHSDLECDAQAGQRASIHGDTRKCVCIPTCSRTSVTCDNGEWKHNCPGHSPAGNPNLKKCKFCPVWVSPLDVTCEDDVIQSGFPGDTKTCKCKQFTNISTTVICDENQWKTDCKECDKSKVPVDMLCEDDVTPQAPPGTKLKCRSKHTCEDSTMMCQKGNWKLYEDTDKAVSKRGDYIDNLKRNHVNDQYYFECRPGYRLDGVSSLTCKDGRRSAEFPRCVPQVSDDQKCNTSLSFFHNHQDMFEILYRELLENETKT